MKYKKHEIGLVVVHNKFNFINRLKLLFIKEIEVGVLVDYDLIEQKAESKMTIEVKNFIKNYKIVDEGI